MARTVAKSVPLRRRGCSVKHARAALADRGERHKYETTRLCGWLAERRTDFNGKVVDGVTEAVNTCYATYQQQMEIVGIPAEDVRQFQLACGPLILESGLGTYPSG
jgi:hypothetical protein